MTVCVVLVHMCVNFPLVLVNKVNNNSIDSNLELEKNFLGIHLLGVPFSTAMKRF